MIKKNQKGTQNGENEKQKPKNQKSRTLHIVKKPHNLQNLPKHPKPHFSKPQTGS